MPPRTVIAQNCPWSAEYEEASFVGTLHETSVWQRDKYWPIEWALRELVRREESCAELHGAIFRIYSHTAISLSAHFDENDLFEITNLSRDEVYEFRERMQLVFETFFCGRVADQAMFEERNPLIK